MEGLDASSDSAVSLLRHVESALGIPDRASIGFLLPLHDWVRPRHIFHYHERLLSPESRRCAVAHQLTQHHSCPRTGNPIRLVLLSGADKLVVSYHLDHDSPKRGF